MEDLTQATTALNDAVALDFAKRQNSEWTGSRRRYYLHCSDCRTRTRLTGRTAPTSHPGALIREHMCPKCGQQFLFDELEGFILQYYDEKIFQMLE